MAAGARGKLASPVSPQYEPGLIPVHIPEGVRHLDPRIFFLGAPSNYQEQILVQLVRTV